MLYVIRSYEKHKSLNSENSKSFIVVHDVEYGKHTTSFSNEEATHTCLHISFRPSRGNNDT